LSRARRGGAACDRPQARHTRRILVVLEGGLANDATALILYACGGGDLTGIFSLPTAMGEFAAIVAGEMLLAGGGLALLADGTARAIRRSRSHCR